ncbi:MAG: ATP phosphoribosyltransferase [Hyphomicrobium sp.]
MTERLLLAVPSKGRLLEQSADFFKRAGFLLRKVGNERGYQGEIVGADNIEVTYVSASEIVWYLKTGRAHLGITGEDLAREQISVVEEHLDCIKDMGFGFADVVVAIPEYWVDIRTMRDLEEVAGAFRDKHGRWFRIATKYVNLTRRFFALKGVSDYRIVESLGATEAAPAAGTADLIVDITSTGQTLIANKLRMLEDGIILKTEAKLFASRAAHWTPQLRQIQTKFVNSLRF